MKVLAFLLVMVSALAADAQVACCPTCPPPIIKYKTKVKVVKEPVEVVKVVEKVVTKNVYRIKRERVRHYVGLMLGTGPRHIEVVPNEVRLRRGFVVGGQYQFTSDSGLTVGGAAISHDTFLGTVGIGF